MILSQVLVKIQYTKNHSLFIFVSRERWRCHKSFLSPRNKLRWGFSNTAVVPCVRASGLGPCEQNSD